MSNMFSYTSEFNTDINNWDTSNVTNMKNMIRSAMTQDFDLSGRNVKNVTIYDDFDTDTDGSHTLPNFK